MNKLEELEKQVELYEKNIESQQQSLETLKRELEQLKAEKENEVWRPNFGEKFWFLTLNGRVQSDCWMDGGYQSDLYAIGNVFKTDEEAKFRGEQLKVEAELRRFARPFVANEDNYSIVFKHGLNTIRTWHGTTWQHDNIYFPSEEIAQKAIDTVGEERIKKYYFGVED